MGDLVLKIVSIFNINFKLVVLTLFAKKKKKTPHPICMCYVLLPQQDRRHYLRILLQQFERDPITSLN